MIDIYTPTGDNYRFDESTGRVFKNGIVIPSTICEPVFSDCTNRNNPPVFAGLYQKNLGQIITRSGQTHPVSDINSVL